MITRCSAHCDRVLRCGDLSGRRSFLEISLGSQKRELQLCNLDAFDLERGGCGAGGVGVGKRVAEAVPCRIRVALDDGDALSHGRQWGR